LRIRRRNDKKGNDWKIERGRRREKGKHAVTKSRVCSSESDWLTNLTRQLVWTDEFKKTTTVCMFSVVLGQESMGSEHD
jgi:hypothetical protein